MSNGWSWEVFFEAFPLVIKGLGVTVGLTITCYLFALIFGFAWVFLRRIPFKPLNWLVTWIMEFIRSTTQLIQSFSIYFAWSVIPVVGMTLSPLTSAVLALAIDFCTYIGEVYRAAIDSVEKGQSEASTAFNFS